MYDTILVPTDGSTEAEKGEEHGVELAASVGATVHALYVAEEGSNPWLSESIENQQQRAREYGDEITADVAEMADAAGVDCVTATEIGPAPHEKINEYVAENDVDLIVMGAGYHGQIGGLLGSTTEKVLRTSEVPVTTLRRGERE